MESQPEKSPPDHGPLQVERREGGWVLAGPGAAGFGLANEYLSYLVDRNYSPRTVRAYAFGLLHFVRWMLDQLLSIEAVTTEVLLRYLASCRSGPVPGKHDNIFNLPDGRNPGYAPASINQRLAAISGLFTFRSMRDPASANPMPRGKEARRTTSGERRGLLGHLATPNPPSRNRMRKQRRLPRGLDRTETPA